MSSYGSHRESGSKNRADGEFANVVNFMGFFIEMCADCSTVCAHGCQEHGRVRSSAVPQNAVLINSREEDIP